ncbi:hypothetical protein H5410_032679 [Solanum commersonii]|uniref:Uncharacterized protein n=1 Tax=Solanum commersonii TaxID=4109 RepID=A0A9J5YMY1_SOLCO|nr:hypothetical protein H5410_032679 [Solanum commersonii]
MDILIVLKLNLIASSMRQITFNSQPPATPRSTTRWGRAVRLVYEKFARARHIQFHETDEESLRDLSIIAL